MSTNISRLLSELLTRTHTSLENARVGNWEQVIADEQPRRNIINGLFSEPMDATAAAKYRRTMEEILWLNIQLEQLTADARNNALTGAGSISKGRRALNTYAENAG